jgi:hypothetical protein
MATTTNLTLPTLEPAQAQKHVTVNEALLRLDALVQLSVASATTDVEPASPSDGSVYILPAGKSGAAWSAMANGALAYYHDGAWEQITPREGWLAFVKDANLLVGFDGAAWTQAVIRSGLGLGSAALKNTGASGDAIPLLNGANTFSQAVFMPTLVISSGFPAFKFIDSDGPTDAKTMFTVMEGGEYTIFAVNDANTVFNPYMNFTRSGATPTAAIVYSALRPASDASHALGGASHRWSTVYAATGTINTSDAREKTSFDPIPQALQRSIRRVMDQIGVFQWRDAVSRKGADAARLHIGVTAQAVREAFLAEGLDPARYALFCEDAVMETVELSPARMERSEHRDPSTGEVREIELFVPPRTEQRPARDPQTGEPLTRLGLRPDQLFWLALAALSEGPGSRG